MDMTNVEISSNIIMNRVFHQIDHNIHRHGNNKNMICQSSSHFIFYGILIYYIYYIYYIISNTNLNGSLIINIINLITLNQRMSNAEITALEGEIDAAKQKQAAATQKNAGARAALDAEIKALEAEIAEAKSNRIAALAAKDAEIAKLEAEIAAMKTKTKTKTKIK
jgi:hypothetical protein